MKKEIEISENDLIISYNMDRMDMTGIQTQRTSIPTMLASPKSCSEQSQIPTIL